MSKSPASSDNQGMRPRVLIVDDHAVFRASARRMLETDGFDVVGEAEDARSAFSAVRELNPDVVLLDVQLPDLDGFDVAARISDQADCPDVVLTSSRDSSDFGPLVLRCGARGFIPKSELSGSVLAEILE
jgi:DNA-binding NarL/FixJ family response regulator